MDTKILRSKILDLAIRGKLVPQDAADGSALDLLAQIGKERGCTIKPLTEDVPFDIPENWCWMKLGDVFSMKAGKFIEAKAISSEKYEGCYPCYGGNGLRGYVENSNHSGEHTIIGRQGALCGNVKKVDGLFYATEHAVVVTSFGTDVNWEYYFLTQLNLNQYASSTAQPGLSVKIIEKVPSPLPPLAEQKRIVAKVEELLAEVEKIELAQKDIADSATILQSKVLDLAIRGKLVPQDAADGSALDLLAQISKERGCTIKPLTEDVPFDIPENWCWVKLPDLCREKITDGTHRSPQNYKEGVYRYITAKNIEDSGISDKNITYVSEEDHREIWNRCKPMLGDVLLTKDGSIGRSTVNNLSEEFSLLSSVALIKPIKELLAWYLVFYFRSPIMQDKMLHGATGTALKRIVLEHIKSYVVPLPPLAEQKRIVAKVEELLEDINKLK